MKFKFRNKEYNVERDTHQFILSQKQGKEYVALGYYVDAYFLIKKLVSLHLIKPKDSKDMVSEIHATCSSLGNLLEKAVKQPLDGVDSTIEHE